MLYTSSGPIELLERGEGTPVLVVHGIWGGIDQGLLNVRGVLGGGFRALCVSRFAYLRSPKPENATPERQADLFAALLDALGVAKVQVIAHSAGATSGMHRALRYPQRVGSLTLVSPSAPGRVKVSLPPGPVAELAFRSDLLF